jgi:hypothetical protein
MSEQGAFTACADARSAAKTSRRYLGAAFQPSAGECEVMSDGKDNEYGENNESPLKVFQRRASIANFSRRRFGLDFKCYEGVYAQDPPLKSFRP